MKLFLIALVAFVSVAIISTTGSETHSEAELSFFENDAVSLSTKPSQPQPLMVPLTLIQGAAAKGAGTILLLLSLSLSLSLSLQLL